MVGRVRGLVKGRILCRMRERHGARRCGGTGRWLCWRAAHTRLRWPSCTILTYMPRGPCRCRKELSVIFAKVIRGRRESGTREEDVLQQFIDARWAGERGVVWGGGGKSGGAASC